MNQKKKPHKRLTKILLSMLVIITLLVVIIILFISPIAKYLVEKYDVKYTGREIKIDGSYVNPFTGYIHFSNVKIYEQKNDTVFFSAKGLSINLSLLKLLSKTYEINSLVLDQPKAMIIKNKTTFNFSDIIEKLSPKVDSIKDAHKEPLHFNLLNVGINDGEFYFNQPQTPVNYSIVKVDFKSGGKYWNADTIDGHIAFKSGIGSGDIKGDFMINTKTLDYRFAALVNKFNMGVMKQYLKDLASYGNLSGSIDADMKGEGNFKNKQSIDAHGKIAISDFHFGKDSTEDYVSYHKLTLVIDRLAPANKKYFFDSIKLEEPYFKYERYDYLDNVQRMFGKRGAKVKAVKADPEKFNLVVEISDYIRTIFKNFFRSDYKVNNFAIINGDIRFNDYSISEKFAVALNPLNIKADSIDNTNEWVKLYLQSGLKPAGLMNVSISMNPKNNKDFDFVYKFQKIPAAAFNPYLITYTSFPLDRGTIEMFGNWKIRNDVIQSNNHFLVIDPRLTKKIRKKDTRWIPMPLIMAFVRERGNVIDYEIPITGDLKNPNFHLTDVILDLVKNIFVKPATTPYRLEVKNTENVIEKSLSFKWAMRQTELNSAQEKFVNKITGFLKDNPDANITVHPFEYTDKEKEYILFYEAKKKYFFVCANKRTEGMTKEDSLSIEKMSSKDTSFIKYLDDHIKDTLLFTVQEKCYRLVGESLVNKKFRQLEKQREKIFMQFFKDSNTEKQIKFFPTETTIPYNGFSYFKINYKGEIPTSLIDAFEKLNEINLEPPREKYLKFRKGINLFKSEKPF